MDVPKIEREVVVEGGGPLIFFATPDALETVRRVGLGPIESGPTPNRYCLWLDPRFDYKEVKAWINSLGGEN